MDIWAYIATVGTATNKGQVGCGLYTWMGKRRKEKGSGDADTGQGVQCK